MKKKNSNNNLFGFLGIFILIILISLLTQLITLFENYSKISKVNVEIIEMLKEDKPEKEIVEYINNSLFRNQHRGHVLINNEKILRGTITFNRPSGNTKVEVLMFYTFKLPFNLFEANDLKMISRRTEFLN